MSQFCPKCRKEIPSAANYCMYCGFAVSLKAKDKQKGDRSKKVGELNEKISELERKQNGLEKELSEQKIKVWNLELELKLKNQEIEKYKEIKTRIEEKNKIDETDNTKTSLIILSILFVIVFGVVLFKFHII
jgi:septal ring factor EnvC (AmiA/AmiB activator)